MLSTTKNHRLVKSIEYSQDQDMSTFYKNSLIIVRTTSHCKGPTRPTQILASRCTGSPFCSTYLRTVNLAQDCLQRKTVLPRPSRSTASFTRTGLQSRGYSTQHPQGQTCSSAITKPTIHPIFEPTTGTFQYIVSDPSNKSAVIIDPVLDFDPSTQAITTRSADTLLALIASKSYSVHYILETHAHADHLSAASYLQAQLIKTGARPDIGIGQRIGEVQKLFSARYGVPSNEYSIAFDCLLSDDEILTLGNLEIKAIHLPGHTPDHMGYLIGANIFCGDSLFNADIGTARTDFPGGSAHDLWASAQKLLSYSDETRIWTGHDYPPEGRQGPVPFMTVGQHKGANRHVGNGLTEEDFVKARRERDAASVAPRLLHQSLQINVRGGRLPEVDQGGRRMLRVPLKLDGVELW